MKCFVLAVFLNCKSARLIVVFQNGFENWILNVFGNWIVWIKFSNIKLLYYIRKKNIQNLCSFRFSCEHLFIFSRFYFLSGYWLVREQKVLLFSKISYYLQHFFIQILVIFVFSFFQQRHTFFSFIPSLISVYYYSHLRKTVRVV